MKPLKAKSLTKRRKSKHFLKEQKSGFIRSFAILNVIMNQPEVEQKFDDIRREFGGEVELRIMQLALDLNPLVLQLLEKEFEITFEDLRRRKSKGDIIFYDPTQSPGLAAHRAAAIHKMLKETPVDPQRAIVIEEKIQRLSGEADTIQEAINNELLSGGRDYQLSDKQAKQAVQFSRENLLSKT